MQLFNILTSMAVLLLWNRCNIDGDVANTDLMVLSEPLLTYRVH